LKNCFRISSKQKQTINRGHPIKIRITVSKETTKQISEKEAKAKRIGDYRLLRRIAIMRMVEAGLAIASIALMMGLAEQTVRNWIHIDIKKKILGISDSNTQGLTVAAHEGKHLVWGVGKVS
jgi:DNA-binding NarL/FixJ family response regulator